MMTKGVPRGDLAFQTGGKDSVRLGFHYRFPLLGKSLNFFVPQFPRAKWGRLSHKIVIRIGVTAGNVRGLPPPAPGTDPRVEHTAWDAGE